MTITALRNRAGSEFMNLVKAYANGTDLTDPDVFVEAVRHTLICFYLGPHVAPPVELQEWFMDMWHIELLYLLNRDGLLHPSLTDEVASLVGMEVNAGLRDTRDLDRFL